MIMPAIALATVCATELVRSRAVRMRPYLWAEGKEFRVRLEGIGIPSSGGPAEHLPWPTCCRVVADATPAPRASRVPPKISTALLASAAFAWWENLKGSCSYIVDCVVIRPRAEELHKVIMHNLEARSPILDKTAQTMIPPL